MDRGLAGSGSPAGFRHRLSVRQCHAYSWHRPLARQHPAARFAPCWDFSEALRSPCIATLSAARCRHRRDRRRSSTGLWLFSVKPAEYVVQHRLPGEDGAAGRSRSAISCCSTAAEISGVALAKRRSIGVAGAHPRCCVSASLWLSMLLSRPLDRIFVNGNGQRLALHGAGAGRHIRSAAFRPRGIQGRAHLRHACQPTAAPQISSSRPTSRNSNACWRRKHFRRFRMPGASRAGPPRHYRSSASPSSKPRSKPPGSTLCPKNRSVGARGLSDARAERARQNFRRDRATVSASHRGRSRYRFGTGRQPAAIERPRQEDHRR